MNRFLRDAGIGDHADSYTIALGEGGFDTPDDLLISEPSVNDLIYLGLDPLDAKMLYYHIVPEKAYGEEDSELYFQLIYNIGSFDLDNFGGLDTLGGGDGVSDDYGSHDVISDLTAKTDYERMKAEYDALKAKLAEKERENSSAMPVDDDPYADITAGFEDEFEDFPAFSSGCSDEGSSMNSSMYSETTSSLNSKNYGSCSPSLSPRKNISPRERGSPRGKITPRSNYNRGQPSSLGGRTVRETSRSKPRFDDDEFSDLDMDFQAELNQGRGKPTQGVHSASSLPPPRHSLSPRERTVTTVQTGTRDRGRPGGVSRSRTTMDDDKSRSNQRGRRALFGEEDDELDAQFERLQHLMVTGDKGGGSPRTIKGASTNISRSARGMRTASTPNVSAAVRSRQTPTSSLTPVGEATDPQRRPPASSARPVRRPFPGPRGARGDTPISSSVPTRRVTVARGGRAPGVQGQLGHVRGNSTGGQRMVGRAPGRGRGRQPVKSMSMSFVRDPSEKMGSPRSVRGVASSSGNNEPLRDGGRGRRVTATRGGTARGGTARGGTGRGGTSIKGTGTGVGGLAVRRGGATATSTSTVPERSDSEGKRPINRSGRGVGGVNDSVAAMKSSASAPSLVPIKGQGITGVQLVQNQQMKAQVEALKALAQKGEMQSFGDMLKVTVKHDVDQRNNVCDDNTYYLISLETNMRAYSHITFHRIEVRRRWPHFLELYNGIQNSNVSDDVPRFPKKEFWKNKYNNDERLSYFQDLMATVVRHKTLKQLPCVVDFFDEKLNAERHSTKSTNRAHKMSKSALLTGKRAINRIKR